MGNTIISILLRWLSRSPVVFSQAGRFARWIIPLLVLASISPGKAEEPMSGIIIYTEIDHARDEIAIALPFVKAERHPLVTNVTTSDGRTVRVTNNQLKELVRPTDLGRLTVVDDAGVGKLRLEAASIRSMQERYRRAKAALEPLATRIEGLVQTIESGNVLVQGRLMSRGDYEKQVEASAPKTTNLTVDGRSYTEARLTSAREGMVSIMHSGGVASVPIDKLSDDQIDRLNTTSSITQIEKPKEVAAVAEPPVTESDAWFSGVERTAEPEISASVFDEKPREDSMPNDRPGQTESSEPIGIPIQRVALAPEEITSAEQVAETRLDGSGSTLVGVPDALSDGNFATENDSLEGTDEQMDIAESKVVPIPSERVRNGSDLFPIRILIGTTMVLVALVLGMGVVLAVAIGRRRRIDHSDDGSALSRSGEAVYPGHRVFTARFPTWAAPALAGVGVAIMAGTGFLIATGGWREDRVASVWIDHKGESAALREAAKSGDSFAQFRLAACYRDSLGIEADPAEAFRWFRTAAESGHVGAQTQVAIDYLMEGGGVPVDFEQAIMWLQKASAAGDVEARTHLGWCHANGFGVSQDFGLAERLLEGAAREGNLLAMNGLARLLSGEIDGFEPDLERAFEWYLRAAEAGDRGAKYCVGVCLIEGRGVPGDRDAGWSWIEQSADMNFELAMEAIRERSEQREIAKMNALLRQQIERNLQQHPQGGNPFSANPYNQYVPPQFRDAQRRAYDGLREQGYSDEVLHQQGYR